MTKSKKFFVILIAVLLVAMAILVPVLPAFAGTPYSVTLSSYSGAPGTALYVYATPTSTFTGGTYAVNFSTITLTSVIVGAGASSISTYFGVPILPRGSYNITITPPAGDTQNIPYPSFVITPQITLGTTSGHIGDRLTISGNGFAANNTITIYFDGIPQTPVSAITTDAYGEFANAAIIVPSMQGGSHTVTALDSIGSSPGVAYSISSSMTLSATTGTVGSTIAVSVTGFAANTTPSFLIDGTAVTVSVRTDAYGSLSNVSVVIPPLCRKSYPDCPGYGGPSLELQFLGNFHNDD